MKAKQRLLAGRRGRKPDGLRERKRKRERGKHNSMSKLINSTPLSIAPSFFVRVVSVLLVAQFPGDCGREGEKA